MDLEKMFTVLVPVSSVIIGYFSILNQIQDKINKKNEEQDDKLNTLTLMIKQNENLITYERRLTVEQQKNILKRVKYKLLTQDEKIDNLLHYMEVISKNENLPIFRNRESKIDIEITRSLMNEDEMMSGDLNSETLS